MTANLVDVPEEVCDLNPQKTCRYMTKLVPRLVPEHQCTIVPKETCILKFSQPTQVAQDLQTRWCLDPTPAIPGESYDEDDALGAPIGKRQRKTEETLVISLQFIVACLNYLFIDFKFLGD